MLRHTKEGLIGESLGVMTLKNKGYQILCTNFKTKLGEIDIIAKDKDMIVFVEVKARNSIDFGYPREAVTPHKQQKIRLVAMQYLKKFKLINEKCRFDVIEVLGDNINFSFEHLVDAF